MDFASLKAKAQEAAAKGQTKLQPHIGDLRNKASSVSVPGLSKSPSNGTASTSSARPAPSPAPKPSSFSRLPPSVKASPPPPPAPRARAEAPLPRATEPSRQAGFKWSTISQADKEAFFGLLDQYFQGRSGQGEIQSRPPIAPALKETIREAPPTARDSPRPLRSSNSSYQPPSEGFSYPPSTKTGSCASDFASYFNERWPDFWYMSQNTMPPPLRSRTDVTWTAGIMQLGNQKTLTGCAFFCDLSICNYQIVFNTNNPSRVDKDAFYTDRPPSMGGDDLYQAYATYGELVAQFAEQAEASRRPVARGECWDMAHEALQAMKQYDLAQPVPSISRTHGHLIYCGRAWGKSSSEQSGFWRGGDIAVRRGDIVEWKLVTIREANAPRGSWSKLGDPEHTAIIISDTQPRNPPVDGSALRPSDLGHLTVIEQSAGQVPTRRTYDLAGFEKGEMWIYRPVSLLTYVGCNSISAQWPPQMPMHRLKDLKA